MTTGLMVLWVAAALGQAPAGGGGEAWLKSVPADIDLVARVRGSQATRDDLVKMLESTSRELAAQTCPTIEQQFAQFQGRYGENAAKAPLMFLLRLPKPDAGGTPPYAFLIQSGDYAGVQKQLAGPAAEAKPKPHDGGFDEIKGQDGMPLYTFKGPGFVAFSNDDALMAQVVKPKAPLEGALSASQRKQLLRGDLGIYANTGSFYVRYKDEINQLRQQFVAGVEQGAQGANADLMKNAKDMYSKLFDSFKDAQSLVVSCDFSPQELDISGEATPRPGSDTAKLFTGPKTSPADALGKLPVNLTNYLFFQGSRGSTEQFLSWGITAMSAPSGNASIAYKKAMDLQHQAGVNSLATASGMGPKGLEGMSVSTYDDPQKAVEATTAMVQAANAPGSPLKSMVKSLEVKTKAETYKGFTLNRSKITWDVAKLAQLQPNTPGMGSMMKSMLGDSITTWFGTDGKVMISLVAPDFDRAKAMIDAYQAGDSALSTLASFKAVRPKLPADVNGLAFLSAQGLVNQFAAQLSAMAGGNAAIKPPADMPKQPVLMGFSFVSKVGGFEFQGVVPTTVGAVLEKGLFPMLQQLQGQVNK